jgi:hypothetical protein
MIAGDSREPGKKLLPNPEENLLSVPFGEAHPVWPALQAFDDQLFGPAQHQNMPSICFTFHFVRKAKTMVSAAIREAEPLVR